jgi:hypothetical protein
MIRRKARFFGILTAAYLLAVVASSTIDLTYTWYSPLTDGTPWYSSVGLERGMFAVRNHDYLLTGFEIKGHRPTLVPLPVFAIAGPEGGIIFISNYALALLFAVLHFVYLHGSGRLNFSPPTEFASPKAVEPPVGSASKKNRD